MRRPQIVIGGSVAQNPHYGGHTWVFLQYLLGFRRLGYDVLLIDRLWPEMCGGADPADSLELRRFMKTFERFGLGGSVIVLDRAGGSLAGVTREEALRRTRGSAFLLNVMGFLTDAEILDAARKRVFLDIDPGFPQMWRELGLADILDGHDAFATFGRNVGRDDCAIPDCGRRWIHTRPPVVLEQWPASSNGAVRSFAAIGAWRGPFAPVEYRGRTFGLRAHEFRALATLPLAVPSRFEAALDIDPADARDIDLLSAGGWRLTDAREATGDPWAYRNFIARAGAEVMVAKGMYVRSRAGWFSDRSACFLASGKPVLAQDTGLSGEYPVGEGLLLFSTPEEAVRGAESISSDYPRHAQAARTIAERCFASDHVLRALAEEVMAS
jgi:hypothetical protein